MRGIRAGHRAEPDCEDDVERRNVSAAVEQQGTDPVLRANRPAAGPVVRARGRARPYLQQGRHAGGSAEGGKEVVAVGTGVQQWPAPIHWLFRSWRNA